MLRGSASRLTIEIWAPDPSAAHAGSCLQKRGLAHTVEGGPSREEHISLALSLDSPHPNSAKLPADIRQAVTFFSGYSAEGVRSFWGIALHRSIERWAELEGERRDELLRVAPQRRPFDV